MQCPRFWIRIRSFPIRRKCCVFRIFIYVRWNIPYRNLSIKIFRNITAFKFYDLLYRRRWSNNNIISIDFDLCVFRSACDIIVSQFSYSTKFNVFSVAHVLRRAVQRATPIVYIDCMVLIYHRRHIRCLFVATKFVKRHVIMRIVDRFRFIERRVVSHISRYKSRYCVNFSADLH